MSVSGPSGHMFEGSWGGRDQREDVRQVPQAMHFSSVPPMQRTASPARYRVSTEQLQAGQVLYKPPTSAYGNITAAPPVPDLPRLSQGRILQADGGVGTQPPAHATQPRAYIPATGIGVSPVAQARPTSHGRRSSAPPPVYQQAQSVQAMTTLGSASPNAACPEPVQFQAEFMPMPAPAFEEPLELQVKKALELIASVSNNTEERLAAIEAKQLGIETRTSGLQYSFDEMKACFGDIATNVDILAASSRRGAAEGDEEMLVQMRASIERLESQTNMALNTLSLEKDVHATMQLRIESLEAKIAELVAAPPARGDHQEAISGLHANIVHLESQCNLALSSISSQKDHQTAMQRQLEHMLAQVAQRPRDAAPGDAAGEQHAKHLLCLQEMEGSLMQRIEALRAQLEQHQSAPAVMRHDFDGALEEYSRSLADLHSRCDVLAQSQGGSQQLEPGREDVTLALQELRQHIQAEHDERVGFTQEITMALQRLREHVQSGIQPGQVVCAAPGEDYVALLQQLTADIQTERSERLNSAEALNAWQSRMEESMVKASVETLDTLRMEVSTLHGSAREPNQDAATAPATESAAAPVEIIRMLEAEQEARAEIARAIEVERGARAELQGIVEGLERGSRAELLRAIEMEQGARAQDLQREGEARHQQVADLSEALQQLSQRMELNAQQAQKLKLKAEAVRLRAEEAQGCSPTQGLQRDAPAGNAESPPRENMESLLLSQRNEMEQKLTELLTVTVQEKVEQAIYEGATGAGAGRDSCITADLAKQCGEHAKEFERLQRLVDDKANASNQAIATSSSELRNELDVLRQTMAVMTEQIGMLGRQAGAPDPPSSPGSDRASLNGIKLEFGTLRAELSKQSTDIMQYHREMISFMQDGQPCLNHKVSQDITESRAVLGSMKQCLANIQAEVAMLQCSEVSKHHGGGGGAISEEVSEDRAVPDSMKQCIANIQAEVATQCSEVDKYRGDMGMLSKEVSESRAVLDSMKQCLANIQAEVAMLQCSEISKYHGGGVGGPVSEEVSENKAVLDNMKKCIANVQAEVATQWSEIDKYRGDMGVLSKEVSESRAVLDSMKQCIANIQAEVATQCSEIDKYHGDMGVLISKEVSESRQTIKEELQRDLEAEREDRLRSEKELWSSFGGAGKAAGEGDGDAGFFTRFFTEQPPRHDRLSSQGSGRAGKAAGEGDGDAGFFTRFFTG